ncbi:MAG: SynChlorMet cassette protein ScmD [Deltaproteobacteria bacterium]|nr:MAG: SynChlorMet cassette protein ScmD [Deltaproteobacteria bacterium]
MELSNKPVANPVVVLREEFDDWAVLFNPDTAEAVGTNPVGVAIWKLMDGKRSLQEIVKEIEDRFADVPDAAIDEVAAFVSRLVESGFVGYDLEGFSE